MPEWREAYNGMLPEVSRFCAEQGQNLALFRKYKAIRASAEYSTLSPARQRIIDHEVRDFRLSGAELPEEQRVVLMMITVDGLSYKETAEALDVPMGTVMSRLARARARLADAIGGAPDGAR